MRIRFETNADRAAIRAVNEAAFATSTEASTIRCLRDGRQRPGAARPEAVTASNEEPVPASNRRRPA